MEPLFSNVTKNIDRHASANAEKFCQQLVEVGKKYPSPQPKSSARISVSPLSLPGLPTDLIQAIFSHLATIDLLTCRRLSQGFKPIAFDTLLNLRMAQFARETNPLKKFDLLYKVALQLHVNVGINEVLRINNELAMIELKIILNSRKYQEIYSEWDANQDLLWRDMASMDDEQRELHIKVCDSSISDEEKERQCELYHPSQNDEDREFMRRQIKNVVALLNFDAELKDIDNDVPLHSCMTRFKKYPPKKFDLLEKIVLQLHIGKTVMLGCESDVLARVGSKILLNSGKYQELYLKCAQGILREAYEAYMKDEERERKLRFKCEDSSINDEANEHLGTALKKRDNDTP